MAIIIFDKIKTIDLSKTFETVSKEREILIQNRVNEGYDRDEAEIMVDARLKKT